MRINKNKVILFWVLAASAAAQPVRPNAALEGPQDAAAAQEPVTRARYAMGTVCEITVYGPGAQEAVSRAFEEIERWEEILSLYRRESEASRMNRLAQRRPFSCSEKLWRAVTASLEMARRSGGAFDPTLSRDGYAQVRLDAARRSVFFKRKGLKLDFGGIGKGLALDHAAAVLRRLGFSSALLNFGGQVYALGAPPQAGAWRVESPAGSLELKDASVSVSGQSQRPGHIISPWTGRAAEGPEAVVLAPTAAEADAWSTALYVTAGRFPAAFKACSLCRYLKGGSS